MQTICGYHPRPNCTHYISPLTNVKRCIMTTYINLKINSSWVYQEPQRTRQYFIFFIKLNESTSRRHLNSPRSLSGRSLHLIFQGHGQGPTWWSLRPSVQFICVLFILWQSNHFWLRYIKFQNRSWKFKVKVMANVKFDGQIWGLGFNRYVCFLFLGNLIILGQDMADSIFDLEKSRSRSQPRSNPMVTFEA